MVIGVGTDIIEIKRIEKAVEKTESFFNKIYTKREQQYYIAQHKKVQTLAGLFAGKEAVSKALGTGFRGFRAGDIEIIPDKLGRPEVTLYGGAKERAQQLGVKQIHISISHCQSYATSFAVAEGDRDYEATNTSSNE